MRALPAPRGARAAPDGGRLSPDPRRPPERAASRRRARACRTSKLRVLGAVAALRDRLMAGIVHVDRRRPFRPLRGRRACRTRAARSSCTRRRSSPAAAAAPTTIRVIDLDIDNGNHLLLSGNRAALGYLRRIGGLAAMTTAPDARPSPSPILQTGERWTLRPNPGPPALVDSRLRAAACRARARRTTSRRSAFCAPAPDTTVGDAMTCSGAALRAAVAAGPARRAQHRAGAKPTHGSPRRSCARRSPPAARPAARWSRPAASPPPSSTPALAFLQRARRRGQLRPRRCGRSRSPTTRRGGARSSPRRRIALGPDDAVVLAVPPVVARALVPGLAVPEAFHAIVNAHFRIAPPRRPAAHPRRRQRHDGVAFRLSRPAFRHDQLRRPADGDPARGAGRDDLARGRER